MPEGGMRICENWRLNGEDNLGIGDHSGRNDYISSEYNKGVLTTTLREIREAFYLLNHSNVAGKDGVIPEVIKLDPGRLA